jgi:hypothetical protein
MSDRLEWGGVRVHVACKRGMERRTRFVVALCACVASMCVLASGASGESSEHAFELVPGSFHFTPSTLQAGAHADWTTSFAFEPEAQGSTYGDARNITVELPTGFDASNTVAPTCTQAQLLGVLKVGEGLLSQCPLASQVGTITLEIMGSTAVLYTSPLYNMEVTSFGTTAELGYKTAILTGLLQIGVRSSDLGLTSSTTNIPKLGEVHKVSVTVWGLPASHEHDAMRGAVCGEFAEFPPVCRNEFGSPQPANTPVKPFLSNPTKCGNFEARMEADSWEEPLNWTKASDRVGPIVECERVQFEPEIEALPSTRSAESPSGLEVVLGVPQTWENPYTIATSYLKATQVTLPEGMTANPGLAEGLGACTPAQYENETSSSLPGEGCPPESKIGSILIETPLLGESIPGSIYIATPYDNPFGDAEHPGGSLLALYIVGKDPQRGLLIKVAGKIEPNPITGQLVTTFAQQPGVDGAPGAEGLPQQPFSKFILKFRPGATAPLISPPTCGAYAVQGALTPWSAPEEPRLIASQPFQIDQGVHEGACPTGGVPPFKPQVISGTQNNAGGNYSPFYLRISREDGEQELVKFSTILPPGLTGNLTGIPFCPDASIEVAKTVTGAQEEEDPSCPVASEIGHTLVEAGVGSVLAQNPGRIYLAGPYHGAPLSIVSVTSAKVGPFDLGTVVIRFALDINPLTAQVEVSGAQSDPIPHIIKGIVVHVRNIRVYMDRHDFTINPTNCQPLGITDEIVGSGSNYANPANQDTVDVSTPFEGADCASLAFKPVFKASTSGKTSRTKGASLTVKLTVAGGLGTQSNIRSVKVDLPKQLPSRLTTLQKACADNTFNANPAACPTDSKVGVAKALTPILPVPLEGPAYFVSHGGAKFPELIIVLQGYGFTIDLHGETFINKQGITSSTFRTIPDQPVTSFQLTLPQGPDSALAAPSNLCASKLKMPTLFTAQNGAVIKQSTPITVSGCAKTKKHKAKTKHKKSKRKHKKK